MINAPPSTADVLRELNRIKVEFQLRTIRTVLGFPPSDKPEQRS